MSRPKQRPIVDPTIDLVEHPDDSGGARHVLDSRRVAVVHEWLSARAGSEVLFEELASPFPKAQLFALTRNDDVSFNFDERHIATTPLDHFGVLRSNRALALPMMPTAWRSLRRHAYDAVITSSHAFAREFFRPGFDGVHCNYVHAPMRYAWNPALDTRGDLLGPLGGAARGWLKRRDLASVAHVDSFAANSTEIAGRIGEFYERESVVIPPPVDVDFFESVMPRRGGYLMGASRWIPYKRLDLVIEVGARLDMPVVIAGSGPEEANLRTLAERLHPNGVEFHLQPDRSTLRSLMAGAAAFLFPPHEDFGIIAVEVQATGTPVVALGAGGALDTVVDGMTGSHAVDQSVEAFVTATQRCLNLQGINDRCRAHSKQFAAEQFRRRARDWVEATLADGPHPASIPVNSVLKESS